MKSILTMSALAAALFAAPSAIAQQDAPFCLRGGDSGVLDCAYRTMAQCEQAKRGVSNTEACVANPGSTVGSGSSSPGGGSGMAPNVGGSGGIGSPER